MNERLLALADAAGIERRYWDALGTERALEAETAEAVLSAMGVRPDGDVHAATQPALPAVWIAIAGDQGVAGPVIEVPVPADREGQIEWTLELESGGRRRGSVTVPAANNDASPHTNTNASATANANADEGESMSRGSKRASIDFGAPVPLGYHRLRFEPGGAALALIVAPFRCWLPPGLVAGGRAWGISVQLYALRSAGNWGIGDFSDLATLARIAGANGAALIGLNPLHARHLAQPEAASPYWPSSRLFLDPMYVDVEQIEDFAACEVVSVEVAGAQFQSRLCALREAALVDHAGVSAMKLRVMRRLHAHFRGARVRDVARDESLAAFVAAGGAPLARFAEFEARRLVAVAGADIVDVETCDAVDAHIVDVETLDAVDADIVDVETTDAAATDLASAIDFQIYLQWQASLQLDRAAAVARAAGLSLSLYRDLAVGAAADSAETWSDPELVATQFSIGAPPDLLAREGQKWGLPPWNPRVLERRAYGPFAALLAANMKGAGALRIDHVMALTRLFWIPAAMPGTRGCYVRNPFDALTAIVALESARNRCLIIGEDLGSVPDGLRERLHERGFLSYRVLIFERHWNEDGRFKRPWEYPPQALAMVATHDMPTIADYWAGTDIDRRARLQLYPEPWMADEERGRREGERNGLLALLHEIGLGPADPANGAQVTEALHAAIARTPAMLAVAQLDDVLGEVEPANIPGTDREYPNWRRKLSLPLEQLADDPRLARLAAIMREAGRA